MESIKISIKVSTHANYYTTVENHIIPYFKGISVSEPTSETIEDFVKAKVNQGLSPKTVRDITAVLLQIVKYAVKKNYRQALIYDVALPKLPTRKPIAFTQEQQEILVEYIKNNLNRNTLGIIIVLFTGIRLGELCALKWEQINFETGELAISKTIQRVKNLSPKAETKTKLIITEPKSDKSNRDIPIPLFFLEILKTFSKNHNKKEYVMTGTQKPLDPRTCQNRFKAQLKKASLPDMKFHTTRHTFATRAVEVDFDVKSLSEILGHASVRFTLDRYVDSFQEQKKICMEKMSKCY